MNHLTLQELQEAFTGSPSAGIRDHLASCEACRRHLRDFSAIERGLRDMPPERTLPDFTEKVMRRLGISSAPSMTWMMFRNLAPLAALVIVVGISAAVLNYFGVFAGSELEQSASRLGTVSGKVASDIGTGVSAFSKWLGTYFSFAFAKNSFGLTMFLVGILGAVAVFDRFVLMPMMRKRR